MKPEEVGKSPAPPAAKKRPKRAPGGTASRAALTVSQKAEAVALWRAGETTLHDLSKRFAKRPETFSRLFKRMGIEKGSAAAEVEAKVTAKVEARIVSDIEEQMRRIAEAKDESYQFQRALARIAYAEIARARKAELDIGKLKDVMTTLKLAGDVIGNARKELWAVLNVEENDRQKDLDDLPELTVRELTPGEIGQLQAQGPEDTLLVEGLPDLEDDDDGALGD